MFRGYSTLYVFYVHCVLLKVNQSSWWFVPLSATHGSCFTMSKTEQSAGAKAAELSVSTLRTQGCPVLSALWLVALDHLQDTVIGQSLLTLLGPYDRSVVNSPEFLQAVMDAEPPPTRHTRRDLRVVAKEKMKCLVGFERMRVNRGIGGACMPFVFQTAHGKDFSQSRFLAFVHWQDALMEMLKIDFHGGITDDGRFTPVTQIYELQTGDFDLSAADSVYRDVERVCYLIFDWEILESYYLDESNAPRLSSAQIAHVAAGFPAWVYSRLLSMRYIRQEDCLNVIVKKKSRAVSGDFKHLYHFIFEIAGIPVVHHKHVCAELVRPYMHDKVRMKQAKTLAFLSDDQLLCPVWGMDLVNHRNQAFATLLSQKSGSDP